MKNGELGAGRSLGFTELGAQPGVSDDGRVVVFYGNLTTPTGLTSDLTPGPGIFARIESQDGGQRIITIVRLAARAMNGIPDYGEFFSDANKNGSVEEGEDIGAVAAFDADAPLGVNPSRTNPQTGEQRYVAVFQAQDLANRSAIFSVAVDTAPTVSESDFIANVKLPIPVVTEGHTIDGFGPITDLAIDDPINSAGQVVVWARAASGTAVFRAVAPDSECDGLYDNWENAGMIDLGGGIQAPLPGADRDHKDLFVEIDFLKRNLLEGENLPDFRPQEDAMRDVIRAFAQAPVANPNDPDDPTGIRLHLQVDQEIDERGTGTIGVADREPGPNNDFQDLKAVYFGTTGQTPFMKLARTQSVFEKS